jgi:hypothetical protein
MTVRRNRDLRPAPLPGRHLDDGAPWRYSDRIAVRCHHTPGWVVRTPESRRFRCLGCSAALDSGCGCGCCAAGDWVGPVR